MKTAAKVALAIVGLVVGLQLVPYGRNHSNPPVRQEPQWDSPETRKLAERACFDCHSNEVKWPWYSHVAPVSWLVQHDVDEGREYLNFSEFDRPQKEAKKAAEELEEGEMPPGIYTPMHPEAVLTPEEKAQLIRSFEAMFGTEAE